MTNRLSALSADIQQKLKHAPLAPFKLRPAVQYYAWGMPGARSLVARLLGEADDKKTYAELWYGAHPKAPSMAVIPNVGPVPLDSLISFLPEEVLGRGLINRFGETLPFLFKVLSINPDFGLSIQAHPDKKLAEKLHLKDPANYPDPNHKPEIAIPVTPLTLLYGFRPLDEINNVIKIIPALQSLAGFSEVQDSAKLKILFSNILLADSEIIRKIVQSIESEYAETNPSDLHVQWFTTLQEKYGDTDAGLIVMFLMNIIKVEPGQGIYIKPNTCHSYLQGDLLECMANSDNVVRAGLTSKFKDSSTLIEMLEYLPSMKSPVLSPAEGGSRDCLRFEVQVDEFEVECLSGKIDNLNRDQRPYLIFCFGESCCISSSNGAFDSLTIKNGEAGIVPAKVSGTDIKTINSSAYIITTKS